MSEQTPETPTTPADQLGTPPEDEHPEQHTADPGPRVRVGEVVRFVGTDTYGNKVPAVGLVSELFEDRRHHPDDTWGEPELFARVAQLPDAGVFPVSELNPDD